MFTTSYDYNGSREWKLCQIEPVDVKIYYEDKKPYIDYVGEAIAENGMKVKVHIPKIGLSFNQLHCKEESNWFRGLILDFKLEAFATPTNNIMFTITECEMTKEQIDALAGCKVKIVEGKK
jgi:hypothetical protein